jgi:hypothetical protein
MPLIDGESLHPTPYAVFCRYHGRVYLTHENYSEQMDDGNRRWLCPRMDVNPLRFGLCGAPSEFDDETYEDAMYSDGEEEER